MSSLLSFFRGSGLVAIVAALAGFWAGQQMISRTFAEHAISYMHADRVVAVSREINLWNEARFDRIQYLELANAWEESERIVGEARLRFRQELKRRSEAIYQKQREAERAILELQRVKSEWADQVVPADIVCGVLRGVGCSGDTWPATNPADDPDLEVRERAAAAGGGSSGLPGALSGDDEPGADRSGGPLR